MLGYFNKTTEIVGIIQNSAEIKFRKKYAKSALSGNFKIITAGWLS
jgi:hypothetical protein